MTGCPDLIQSVPIVLPICPAPMMPIFTGAVWAMSFSETADDANTMPVSAPARSSERRSRRTVLDMSGSLAFYDADRLITLESTIYSEGLLTRSKLIEEIDHSLALLCVWKRTSTGTDVVGEVSGICGARNHSCDSLVTKQKFQKELRPGRC